MIRTVAGRAVLVLAAVAGPLLLTPAPVAASGHAVTMAHYAFSPNGLTVTAGDTVTWTNQDTDSHNVVTTSGPASFSSPLIATGRSWSYTFTVPGTYAYYCSVHPDMRAQLVVRPVPAPPTTRVAAPPPTTAGPAPTGHAHAAPAAPVTTAPAGTPPATAAATGSVPAVVAASAGTGPELSPLLLLTGLATAVVVFCLLVLGSRRAAPVADNSAGDQPK
jgi:plastocyanin